MATGSTDNLIHRIRAAHRRRRELDRWAEAGYAMPAPPFVKRAVLRRNGLPGATWVETGTFQGDTTDFLAADGSRVVTIEPEPRLHAAAAERFRGRPNVDVRHGLSEDVMPALLPTIEGDVCFWLDGHYSAGVTYKGPKDTPIVDELACIAMHLPRWRRVVVMVDDVRCFEPWQPDFAGYPPRDHLVKWAASHGLRWHIEHDIFVARTPA